MLQVDKVIADAINDHFSTTGKKLASNINTKHNFKKYIDYPNQHTCFLYPTNEQEVIKEINKLNPNVPEQLKLAKVIPIYKKNETHLPENYRPISLLRTLNKIMEKIMYRRIILFLNKHKVLYKYQIGFRHNHSTSMALIAIEIIDNIRRFGKSEKKKAGIFMDFSKAFDTVDHQILLDKLENYGFRGQILKWLTGYLHNRQYI